MMPDLTPFKATMSAPMYAEFRTFVAGLAAGDTFAIERVTLDAGGYATSSGRYFGTCERGERIYCVNHYRGTFYVRTRADLRTLTRVFEAAGATRVPE